VELRFPELVDFSALSGSVYCCTRREEPSWWRCVIQRVEDLPVGMVLSRGRTDRVEDGPASARELTVDEAWEREARDTADVVVVGVEEDQFKVVSLIELGWLCANSPNKVVCLCPDGFLGRGEVELAAQLHGLTLVRDSASLATEVRRRLEEVNGVVAPGCAVS
jgi:hypothetical protein